jgi:chemotaxis protein CheD
MKEIVTIGISEFKVASAPRIIVTYGLGSCIGIAIHDPLTQSGALAHTLLPTFPTGMTPPPVKSAKYTDLAVDIMVEELLKIGCAANRLVAKLAGGASMFDPLYQTFRGNIGQRNVETARYALGRHGIAVVAEDTGADYGRSVEFHTATGAMVIRALQGPGKTI